MRFYVVRPFRHGEEYLKPRSYVDMSYEEARPHILKRKLVLSQEQPPEETVQEEPPTRSGKSSGKRKRKKSNV